MGFAHYRDSKGIPRATQATIDLVNWVTLNGPTLGCIPRDALLFQDPAIRTEDFDERGRPSTIDWTVTADWYDREVHWRGFTPMRGEGSDTWKLNLDHAVVDARSPGSFIIDPAIAQECTKQLALLFDVITDINSVLLLTQDKVKTPSRPSTQPFDRKHGTKGAVMASLATVRRGFIDGLAYFCWVQTVFEDNLNADNIPRRIAQRSERWMPYLGIEKTGYLLDLSKHWREINLGYYVAKDIPIHYMWTPQLRADPRFARLSPDFLCAHDQILEGASYHPTMEEAPVATPAMERYDRWLQSVTPFEKPDVHPKGIKNHFIIDFEGWTRRTVPTKKNEIGVC